MTGRRGLTIAVAVVLSGCFLVLPGLAAVKQRVCYPGFTIPAVTIPAVTIPAVTIPAVTIPRTCFAGTCYPAQYYPAQHLPAQHVPAQHLPAVHVPGSCVNVSAVFAPAHTTVRVRNYDRLDRAFSASLSNKYWSGGGVSTSYPNPYAAGFGGYNAAGFPKNQYVRSYFRRDGTYVHSYWRNSPTDGLPTCRVIHC